MMGIVLRGVRTHNLQNLDLDIPYRTLTVITGVSGSGKSSLAFDTLYAEGQRRYVESISAYARQFLERMEKPDLDSIEGILPAIAIEAKNIITNARSTVGTQTELNDYLRLLFARIGKTYCTQCGRLVEIDTADSVVKTLFRNHVSQAATIGFPISLPAAKRLRKSVLEEYARQGFLRLWAGEAEYEIGRDLVPESAESIRMVVDELDISEENKGRLVDSIETAFRFGKGHLIIQFKDLEHRFSNRFSCAACGIDFKTPTPNLFSFNSPLGACSTCQGFGRVIGIDWGLVVPNPGKSLAEGAIEPWTKPSAKREWKQLKAYCILRGIPLEKPFKELSAREKSWILEGEKGSDYFSVRDFFEYLEKKKYKMHVRVFLSKYRAFYLCPECGGKRLKAESLAVKISGATIADWNERSIRDLRAHMESLELSDHERDVAAPVLLEIRKRLRFLDEVGLGYLTLERPSRTLSGGESQRIHLATSLGSALVDTLYILDEPSIGLHERDNELLIRLLKELRDLGNTVVIVEHDRTVIEAADRVIDLGPLGGEEGGQLLFSGPFQDLSRSESSLTARYFRGELVLTRSGPKPIEKNGRMIRIVSASEHNLQNISVSFPLERLVAITGVSGSGKSTLMHDVLYANYLRWRGRPVSDIGRAEQIDGFAQVNDVVLIDQSPIGRTPRSNPATYIKAFDEIRKTFAKTREARAHGLGPGHFSFNVSGGRCETCRGEGLLKVEMHFLADVYVTCDDCSGTRFQSSTLDVRYRGKNIHEVLSMTVEEALRHFESEEPIVEKLKILSGMGLGYLKLGQPATTLSGGEAQRLKLAVEMTRHEKGKLLYLFDEPTTGLHYWDISFLLKAFDCLLEDGHSICVIEHNMEIIKHADYLIDLGPEGGNDGGRLVYEGPLNDHFLDHPHSHTARCFKSYLFKSKKHL